MACGSPAPPAKQADAQGYMPRELEVLDSQYGTEAELRHCLATLKAAGVLALADIVVNHRCAGEQVGVQQVALPAASSC